MVDARFKADTSFRATALMRVRCVGDRLSATEVAALGPEYDRTQDFHVTRGREYLGLGLHLVVRQRWRGTGAWVEIRDDPGQVSLYPLALFEIVDARPSRYWSITLSADGSVQLSVPETLKPHFHEEVADFEPDALRTLREIYERLDKEHALDPA